MVAALTSSCAGRASEEFDDALGHIPNAQLIPLSELKARVSEVRTPKPIVAVCHAGMRSGQATVILRDSGLERVANLRGGMLLWQQMGLPTARSAG
jgi:rhodanese-related sulfurtransferase